MSFIAPYLTVFGRLLAERGAINAKNGCSLVPWHRIRYLANTTSDKSAATSRGSIQVESLITCLGMCQHPDPRTKKCFALVVLAAVASSTRRNPIKCFACMLEDRIGRCACHPSKICDTKSPQNQLTASVV